MSGRNAKLLRLYERHVADPNRRLPGIAKLLKRSYAALPWDERASVRRQMKRSIRRNGGKVYIDRKG